MYDPCSTDNCLVFDGNYRSEVKDEHYYGYQPDLGRLLRGQYPVGGCFRFTSSDHLARYLTVYQYTIGLGGPPRQITPGRDGSVLCGGTPSEDCRGRFALEYPQTENNHIHNIPVHVASVTTPCTCDARSLVARTQGLTFLSLMEDTYATPTDAAASFVRWLVYKLHVPLRWVQETFVGEATFFDLHFFFSDDTWVLETKRSTAPSGPVFIIGRVYQNPRVYLFSFPVEVPSGDFEAPFSPFSRDLLKEINGNRTCVRCKATDGALLYFESAKSGWLERAYICENCIGPYVSSIDGCWYPGKYSSTKPFAAFAIDTTKYPATLGAASSWNGRFFHLDYRFPLRLPFATPCAFLGDHACYDIDLYLEHVDNYTRYVGPLARWEARLPGRVAGLKNEIDSEGNRTTMTTTERRYRKAMIWVYSQYVPRAKGFADDLTNLVESPLLEFPAEKYAIPTPDDLERRAVKLIEDITFDVETEYGTLGC